MTIVSGCRDNNHHDSGEPRRSHVLVEHQSECSVTCQLGKFSSTLPEPARSYLTGPVLLTAKPEVLGSIPNQKSKEIKSVCLRLR